MSSRDVFLEEIVESEEDYCEPVYVESEHPLFVLYTSGSTGRPKGIQHSTGGYLLHSVLTMFYTFDIKPDDIFGVRRYWLDYRSYVCCLWTVGNWKYSNYI